MEILNLGSNDDNESELVVKKSKKKTLTAAVGVSGIAAITGLGSTFAANISLNNDQSVEFGQGVTQTVACDSDGFVINPVTRYDNSLSKFRIDYVEITGIDLTPKGTGYSSAGYDSQADAIADHPGQYYDGITWVNTCDGVVLDFKAYTDDSDFESYTVDGTVNSPLYWSQENANSGSMYNSSFAVWINSTGEESSYGADGSSDGFGLAGDLYLQIHLEGANSKLKLQNDSNNYDMFAGAINKFTVESMPSFPSAYETSRSYWGEYYWDTY